MARPIDEALAANAKIARLIDLLGQHSDARIKEAQQRGTAKTSGLLALFETEYAIFGLIEEVWNVDLDDRREELADECLRECGYDLRLAAYRRDVRANNFGLSHPDEGRGFRIGGAA